MKLITALAFGVFTSLAFADPAIEVTAELSPAAIAQATWKHQPELPEMKRMRATLEAGKPTTLESAREYKFPTSAALDREHSSDKKELLTPTAFETRITGPTITVTANRHEDGRIVFHGTCRLTRPAADMPDMSPTHFTVSLVTHDTLFYGVADAGKPFIVTFDDKTAKDATLTLVFSNSKTSK